MILKTLAADKMIGFSLHWCLVLITTVLELLQNELVTYIIASLRDSGARLATLVT